MNTTASTKNNNTANIFECLLWTEWKHLASSRNWPLLYRAILAKRQHLYINNSCTLWGQKYTIQIQIQGLFDIRFFHRYFHWNAQMHILIFLSSIQDVCNRKLYDRIFTIACIASHLRRRNFSYYNKIIVEIELCLIRVSNASLVLCSCWVLPAFVYMTPFEQNSSLTFNVDFKTTVFGIFRRCLSGNETVLPLRALHFAHLFRKLRT